MIQTLHRAAIAKKADTGGGFSPPDIAGLVLWLDASQEVLEGTGPDDPAEPGDTVTMWRDQSGNNNDPDSLISATYQTTPDRVVLAGVRDQIKYNTTNPIRPANATSFFVFKQTGGTSMMLLAGTGAQTLGTAHQGSASASLHASAGSPSYYTDGVLSTAVTRDDLWTEWATGNTTVVTAHNHVLQAWTSELLIHTYPHLSLFHLTGDSLEILIYDSNLSTDDRQTVETYLGDRHGVTITH